MKQRTFRSWTLVPEFRAKIRNRWIEPPVWYEASQAHPPPYTYGYQRKAGKPKVITFPEDKLKKTFLAKNPWAKPYKSKQFPNQNLFIDSPADVFAAKHIEFTNQGLPESKAYEKALNYVEEMMYSLKLEKQLATEQANALNPFKPTSTADDVVDIAKLKYSLKFERLQTGRMKKSVEAVIRKKKLNNDTSPLTPAEMEGVPRDQIDTYLDCFPEDIFYFRLLDEESEDFDEGYKPEDFI